MAVTLYKIKQKHNRKKFKIKSKTITEIRSYYAKSDKMGDGVFLGWKTGNETFRVHLTYHSKQVSVSSLLKTPLMLNSDRYQIATSKQHAHVSAIPDYSNQQCYM